MAFYQFKRRLLLGFFIGLLPFLAMIFYLFDLWFDTRKQAFVDSERLSAQAMSAYVQAVFDQALVATSLVAKDGSITSMQPKQITPKLEELVHTSSLYSRAVVFNKNGEVVASTGQTQAPYTIAEKDYFLELAEVKRPVISDVIIGKITKKVIVIAGSPVEDEKGNLLGVVTLSIDISELGEQIKKQLTLGKTTTLALLNGGGKLAFATTIPDPTEEERVKFGELLSVKKAIAGEVATVDQDTIPGNQGYHMGIIVPVYNYRWAIAILEPSQDVLGVVLTTQKYFFGITILSIGFFVAVALFTVRRIISSY